MSSTRIMPPGMIPRREFLMRAGGGIGGLALAMLLGEEGALADDLADPLAPRPSHYGPKVKRVISLFMFGGISHLDTFDYRPELTKQDGVSVAGRPGFDTMGRSAPGKLLKSPWKFKPYGKSGILVSDLFPH